MVEGAGMTQKFSPIIGLEIHVELNTRSKMFCGCPANHFGVEPNTHTCPVCLGLPGALPVANEESIRRTIKIGLALDCEIASHSKFDRKNYFYPDLPKGYQISQYDEPLCEHGQLETEQGTVGIHRVHLEEDTAKLQHVTLSLQEQQELGLENANVSLIDFNRGGVPLVEIVTEAEIHSPEQAREFAKNLVHLLRYLEVSDCDMEKGALRLEANISVQNEEEQAAGQLPPYKVEVKNLNSFRFLERAIRHEIERHTKLREAGELPKQETRGWNDTENKTYALRSKESAEDYRYFPDPDLPPLELTTEMIEEIGDELPELPKEKMLRFQQEFGVSEQNARVFLQTKEISERAEQFLTAVKAAKIDPQKAANGVVNNKVETWLLSEQQATDGELRAEIDRLITQTKELYATAEIDPALIQKITKTVMHDPQNAEMLGKLKAGEQKFLGYFIGQVRLAVVAETKQEKVDANAIREEIAQVLAQS
jgi:aspartyl-tRNA(Asn)/glutamyl-tRNA(Gln) amidotransferase subunit B